MRSRFKSAFCMRPRRHRWVYFARALARGVGGRPQVGGSPYDDVLDGNVADAVHPPRGARVRESQPKVFQHWRQLNERQVAAELARHFLGARVDEQIDVAREALEEAADYKDGHIRQQEVLPGERREW